ncbi:MAG: aminopeptidase P family protein [Bradymonadia bacterium]
MDDTTLAAALAGTPYAGDLPGLDALIAGVHAAPRPRDPRAWMVLAGVDPTSEAADHLQARFEALTPAAIEAPSPAARVEALRAAMSARDLAGFVIPRADAHQGEYVPSCAERLAWLTDFTGSAGAAVVLREKAAVFVDGRYTLQVTDQVDLDLFETLHLINDPHVRWAADQLSAGDRLGYDPRLHTLSWIERATATLEAVGATLVPVDANLVDEAWGDARPPAPISPVISQSIELAGESSADKRVAIGEALALAKIPADATVLTRPESIAWLLNVRGADVPRTPLPLSYAIVRSTGAVQWFIDPRKLTPAVTEGLDAEVTVHPIEDLGSALQALGGTVQVDPAQDSGWIGDHLRAGGATLSKAQDPTLMPKATKNAAEQAGTRAAHLRDGVALVKFLAWIDAHGPSGSITELQAVDQLYAFRAESELLRDLSFDTISGSGPNGAIVHYRVTEESDRPLGPGELYLVDSGAQYPDGTTDVTRTVAIGEPTDEMRHRFTRVLQGHIALGCACFPEGTTGSHLDVLARMPLWRDGLDYDHGTGHGVGSYLSVHEGPQRISQRMSTVPLQVGMICSNEPGFYQTDGYGIRIENLVLVVPAEGLLGDRAMLSFETLTLAPIDRRLIDTAMLTESERAWVDAYHARVREALSPHLDAETVRWLEAATQAL